MSEGRAYDQGYEDAEIYFRGLIETIHLEYAAMRREREWLMKKLAERESMKPLPPIILQTREGK